MVEKDNVNSLFNKKKDIENKIEGIQENCTHQNQHLKFVLEKSLGNIVRWVCKDCCKVLTIPTKEEVNGWVEK
jgi:uncharacterized FlaG/YvyC family protein